STGVRIISAVLADFLAGAIIPLPFFPQPFRAIAEMLPFAAMQNMPLRIYSGNIAGINAFWGIGLQVFWLIALILIGRYMINNALRKVVVQGG
ncbi:MAG TPA: ABC transporter permease, partial [Firmicutes bacterium]|nr:ABC transporter permease [Bacillota bacterium]